MLFESEFETQIKFLESKGIAQSSLNKEFPAQELAHGSCTPNVDLITELKIEKLCKDLGNILHLQLIWIIIYSHKF